ncbi:acetyl-CoA carboxylase carboxyltransferase subunit alpha [Micromonospora yasonensis]|uniref:acetyl-CoA carboxylase carboxyltransferase subunit alpha n=1 Tax=Micromonospora yasonensis TaxID=1128667 RepID=UPI0022325639|nr:acetyl-CoA carboxylase carboxyltransferase subunit alpha [Micromonospora yasonensis]MCW3843236.1 acetyl-CoA carboxylase carboxyltransferase subunit alpha [Micromonospora yasonensis]
MTEVIAKPAIPDDAWIACRRCRRPLYAKRFAREQYVCPECGWHAPLTAHQRVELLLDRDGREELPAPATVSDPLDFVDSRPYPQRLIEARAGTDLDEAVICLRGRIAGAPVVLAVMDFRFMGGSLGTAVGERITAAAEAALRERTPLVLVTASGGARMQEGALSLMQMAKTSQALAQLDEAGVLTIAVVTDPTYGGVAASFASLTDIIVAEPKARLGFAGPRVIEQTIRRKLPAGFQSAEFLLEHGLVDLISPRNQLRSALARLLACAPAPADGAPPADPAGPAATDQESIVVTDPAELTELDPWQVVQRARDINRPTTLDYISYLIDGFTELHGDRAAEDCSALVGGLGLLDGRPVVVIGHQKGHTTRELVQRNFGMPSPAGYRKAARLMRLAAKLRVPLVTLIDTPGAYPGPEAEEKGQSVAIAESIRLLSRLPVPVVAVVTGEGGSGGALALGVANRVLMLENAIYSVISPEGCAAILWQTPREAAAAATALRLTAPELLRSRVVDGVIPEPAGGAQLDQGGAAEALRDALVASLQPLAGLSSEDIVNHRWTRFRRYGTSGEDQGRQA